MQAVRSAVWLVLFATSAARAVDPRGVWIFRFTHHDSDSTCRYTLTTGAPGGTGSTVSLAARGTCGDFDGTLDTATGDFDLAGAPFGSACFASGGFDDSAGVVSMHGGSNCLFGGVTELVGAPCTTEPCDYESCTGKQCLIGSYYRNSVCGGGRLPEYPVGLACDDGDPCTVHDFCSAGYCTGNRLPNCEVVPGDCGPCAVHDAIGRCVPDVRSQCVTVLDAAALHLGARHRTVSWWSRASGVAPAQLPTANDLPELCVFDAHRTIVAALGASARCRGQTCWRPGHRAVRYDDAGAIDALSRVRSRGRGHGDVWLRADGVVGTLAGLPPTFPLRVQYHGGAALCWESTFPTATRADATVVKAGLRSTSR